MTPEEFRNWLEEEVRADRLSRDKRDDLLAQKDWFDSNRGFVEREYWGRVVGCANRNFFVEDTVQGVLAAAANKEPRAMVYFEPIGFDII
jgi:hypothetical protein